MRIEWLPEADGNLAAQLDWVAGHDAWAAVEMGDAVHMAVNRLADHPAIGRPGRVAGTRELVVVGTPYIVRHRIEASAVVVLRVLHGAQRWPHQSVSGVGAQPPRPPTRLEFCQQRPTNRRERGTAKAMLWDLHTDPDGCAPRCGGGATGSRKCRGRRPSP